MAKSASGKDKRGDNSIDLKKLKGFYDRLDNVHDDFETKRGEFMSDTKALYREAAAELGVKSKNLRSEYAKMRRDRKEAAKEANLEQPDRDEREILRNALGGFVDTPLGAAAMESTPNGAADATPAPS